jgi:hypothetical protein
VARALFSFASSGLKQQQRRWRRRRRRQQQQQQKQRPTLATRRAELARQVFVSSLDFWPGVIIVARRRAAAFSSSLEAHKAPLQTQRNAGAWHEYRPLACTDAVRTPPAAAHTASRFERAAIRLKRASQSLENGEPLLQPGDLDAQSGRLPPFALPGGSGGEAGRPSGSLFLSADERSGTSEAATAAGTGSPALCATLCRAPASSCACSAGGRLLNNSRLQMATICASWAPPTTTHAMAARPTHARRGPR